MKLREALRDDIRKDEIRSRALAHECPDGCCEGCSEGRRLEGADVGILESSKRLSGKVVVTTGLHCG